MERFVYVNGEFYTRVSNTAEEMARSFGPRARIVKVEPCSGGLCGASERVDLELKPKRITKAQANAVNSRRELRELVVNSGRIYGSSETSRELPQGTRAHYAHLALELGSSVRDNEFEELIGIGKDIDKNGWEGYE